MTCSACGCLLSGTLSDCDEETRVTSSASSFDQVDDVCLSRVSPNCVSVDFVSVGFVSVGFVCLVSGEEVICCASLACWEVNVKDSSWVIMT